MESSRSKRRKIRQTEYEKVEGSTEKPSAFANWSSTSSESETEHYFHPSYLYVSNLADDITKDELLFFFKPIKPKVLRIDETADENGNIVQVQAILSFDSLEDIKSAMQLYGNTLRGYPIYLSRYPNDRNSICVYGFDHTQSEAIIKKQVREIFKKCGNVLDIFIPTSTSTRSHLGFCYLFIDLSNETASESLAKLSETMAQKGNIRFCYVFLKPWVKKSILDSNGKAVLQKIEATQSLNKATESLPTSKKLGCLIKAEWIFSWRTSNPDKLPDIMSQGPDDCWAFALAAGYHTFLKFKESSKIPLTPADIKKGVPARFQLHKGISKIRHVIPFMEEHVGEMKVHYRPKSQNATDFEDFEATIVGLLKETPVVVGMDWPASYDEFEGEGIFCPTEADFHRLSMEKGPNHVLLLTGYGVDRNGEEYWELQDSNGLEWGDGGFIKVARHKRLFKYGVEFKN